MTKTREQYYQQKQKHLNKSAKYKNADLCTCGFIYKDHISETGNWKYRHYFNKAKQTENQEKDKLTPENYQYKLSVHDPMGTKKGEDERLQHHRDMANYQAEKQEEGVNPKYSADKEAYHRDMAAKLESQKTAPMGALPYSETAREFKDDDICECGAMHKEHIKKEQFKLKKDIAAISTPAAAPGVGTGVAMI